MCRTRTAMFSAVPATCVVLALALMGVSVSGQSDDLDSSKVKVRWGISDGLAHVGRLYRMHVPSDAFTGKVLSYSVTSGDGSPLPSWLHFDSKDNVLVGIAKKSDVGEVPLRVVAKGDSSEDEVVFTISVKDLPSISSGSPLLFRKSSLGPELVRCKRDEAETVATIVLDTDMEKEPTARTVDLLYKFLQHMDLQHEMVKLSPVGNSPYLDSAALVSGPGESSEAPKTAGTFLSWPVGCGQVKEGHFKVLQRLDDDSRSGQMATVIGCPVIGWHVSNSHLQPLKRKRRQAVITATPSMTPVMSTKTDEKTEDPGDKMTREVPERTSPGVIQPTATQPIMSKTAMPEMKTSEVEKEMTTSAMVKPSETPVAPTTPPSKTKELPPIQPTATVTEGPKTTTPEPSTTDSGKGGGSGKGGESCERGGKPMVNSNYASKYKKRTFFVGDVVDFTIPADFFVDCEVGGTRGLNVNLFLNKTAKIPDDFFIQFDQKKQKMIGIPMKNDDGHYKMRLVGQKETNNLLVSYSFNVNIKRAKKSEKKTRSLELSVSIDEDYDEFVKNTEKKLLLANKVASLYGDADGSSLVITKLEEGSVVFGWTNKTMRSADCAGDDVKNSISKLINEDGTLTQEAIDKMDPFFLKSAAAAPLDACKDDPNFPKVTSKVRERPTTGDKSTQQPVTDGQTDGPETDKPPMKKTTKAPEGGDDKTTTEEPIGKSSEDDGSDIWITTIVPTIVVVVILILALLIACVLYRKKRKGKMNVEEQNTFVNKGAPVIFPDELEDKPNDVNKPLLVEGSPAPPPEYHRGNSESPDPAMANHRNGPNGPANHDDGITEMPERPYNPPPPVATSSNNKQPRPTQQSSPQYPQILP